MRTLNHTVSSLSESIKMCGAPMLTIIKLSKKTRFTCIIALFTGLIGANIPPVYATPTTKQSIETQPIITAAQLPPYQQRDIKDEVFYFVLPDRFYNGELSNDMGAKANDHKRALSRGGFQPSNKGMYHGGDLVGLTEKLPYLEKMGISAIWLTPVLRNQAVQSGSAGYHGYWILDFTEIDPHFGTNQQLKAFIDAAHKRNIKVFFDIITNHTADVIKYKQCHGADGLSKLTKSGNCPYLSLADLAKGKHYTPIIPKGKAHVKSPSWLNNVNYYHNQGDSNWHGESAVNGDFAGLDDLKTEDPQVVNGMIAIYEHLVDEFKPDGFRIDTVKHVNIEFWQKFSPALVNYAHQQGIKNFFMFGEVYDASPRYLSQFTTRGKLQSVLDFGLQNVIDKTIIDQQGTDKLAKLFAQDGDYQGKNSNANQLVNFISNHDMGRFAYRLQQGKFHYNQTELIARFKLASALMFFSRGVPVIYYGDEQGFVGDGGDQDARQDMMPSKVASYNNDNLLGTNKTTADDNFDEQHPLYKTMARYASLYHQYQGLRDGQQQVIYAQATPGIFAISRNTTSANEHYLVIFNTASIAQPLPTIINLKHAKLLYSSAKDTANSKLLSTMPALSFSIFKQL